MSTKDKILGVSGGSAGGQSVNGGSAGGNVAHGAEADVAGAVSNGGAGANAVGQAGATGTGPGTAPLLQAGARPAEGAAVNNVGQAGANVSGPGTAPLLQAGARPAEGAAVNNVGQADERGVHEFLTPEQVVREHVRPTAPVVNGGVAGANAGVVERDAWPDEFKQRFPQVLDKNGNVDVTKLRELTAADYLDYLQKVKAQNADETDEERKKRLRREKWSRIYNGIGDMVSALSNLYFTTKGAPSADQSNSLSKAYQARLDKMDAEREKRRKELENAYRLEYATGSQLAKDKMNDDYQRARSEAVRTKSLGEAMRLNAQADLLEKQGRKAEADALRAEAVAAYYDVLKQGKEIENKNKPQEYNDKHKVAQSTMERNNAQTNNANAAADEHRRRGTSSWVSPSGSKGGGKSGGKGGKPYGTFLGKSYATKADYDAAVVGYAKRNGIPLTYNKRTTDEFGGAKSTQTNRTIAGLRTDAEAHYARTHGKSGGKAGKGRFSGFSIHKKR